MRVPQHLSKTEVDIRMWRRVGNCNCTIYCDIFQAMTTCSPRTEVTVRASFSMWKLQGTDFTTGH